MLDHRKRITKSKPASPKSNQVPGTLSQFIKFFGENGSPVLMVHQFLRPDGTIGASGLPDPKMMLKDGIEYFC
jgi:hypothetical protein